MMRLPSVIAASFNDSVFCCTVLGVSVSLLLFPSSPLGFLKEHPCNHKNRGEWKSSTDHHQVCGPSSSTLRSMVSMSWPRRSRRASAPSANAVSVACMSNNFRGTNTWDEKHCKITMHLLTCERQRESAFTAMPPGKRLSSIHCQTLNCTTNCGENGNGPVQDQQQSQSFQKLHKTTRNSTKPTT